MFQLLSCFRTLWLWHCCNVWRQLCLFLFNIWSSCSIMVQKCKTSPGFLQLQEDTNPSQQNQEPVMCFTVSLSQVETLMSLTWWSSALASTTVCVSIMGETSTQIAYIVAFVTGICPFSLKEAKVFPMGLNAKVVVSNIV